MKKIVCSCLKQAWASRCGSQASRSRSQSGSGVCVVYILFCFMLPSLGSNIMTYNGLNSSSVIDVTTVSNDSSVSFKLRTRQKNALLMMTSPKSGSGNSGFSVAIENNGQLNFTLVKTNIVSLHGTAISDGEWHNITLKNDNSNITILKIDQTTDYFNTTNFFEDFLTVFTNTTVYIGDYSSSDYSPYEGCLSGIHIGGEILELTMDNSQNTKKDCSSTIDPCISQPCHANGTKTCEDNFNDFLCVCNKFYTTKTCNETKDVNCTFKDDLCVNGKCEDVPGGKTPEYSNNGKDYFSCACNGVFKGLLCEEDVNECELSNSPCKSGNCTNTEGGYSCDCHYGYKGMNCDKLHNETCINEPELCKNGGSCQANHTGYVCVCEEGFTGEHCETKSASIDNDDDDDDLPLIIGLSAAGLIILIIIIVIFVVRYCRDKSGMEGTYSPNKEEQTAGNVEMSTVKKPKTERLI